MSDSDRKMLEYEAGEYRRMIIDGSPEYAKDLAEVQAQLKSGVKKDCYGQAERVKSKLKYLSFSPAPGEQNA